MSRHPDLEPSGRPDAASDVELVIRPRERDLGGFTVRRVLPFARRRHVGPFVFFDHMGPAVFPPGQGMDVRPHPHVCLSTVTYLWEGEIVHRDSLGSHQPIRPGELNWMTAGRGIVHSERTSADVRARGGAVHGIQAWVALPREHEETEPSFAHHGARELPAFERGGCRLRLIAGTAWGHTSPARVLSPTLYVDVDMPAGATLEVPAEHVDRAIYVATGAVRVGGEAFGEGTMVVFTPGATPVVEATSATRAMLLGGQPLGERHISWNFVASDPARIERARADWRSGRFPKVPGDEVEFIPLPE